MSQSGILNRGVYPPGTVVETIQGSNNGVLVALTAPDAANNIILNSTDGNLTFTNGAGNILNLTVSNSPVIAYKAIDPDVITVPSSNPYVALITDEYLSIDTLNIVSAIILPTVGVAQGEQFIIKDRTGNANVFNITITVAGGAFIDGAVSRIINGNLDSVRVIFNGTNYEVY